MSTFHEGELRVQARAGELEIASRVGRGMINPEIPEVAAEFLAQQRLLFVGHRDVDGAVWAGVLSGDPGFISTPDDRTVRIDTQPSAGDPLESSLTEGSSALGLLAIEPETRRRMRINGVGRMRAGVLELRTEQVYANCPKYISTREPDGALAEPDSSERQIRTSDRIDSSQRELIRRADTFFIATTHESSGADVSHRGGAPGFVTVVDEHHLSWPDYRGNSMYNTLGNLDADPHAGLLFVNWDTREVLQLTGTAVTDWSADRAAAIPGARRIVDFTLDRAVTIPRALRGRWHLEALARTNPPAADPST